MNAARKGPRVQQSLFSNQLVEDLGSAAFGGDYYLYKETFDGYSLLLLRIVLQLVTSEADKQNIRKYFGFDLEERKDANFKKHAVEVGQRELELEPVISRLQSVVERSEREDARLVDPSAGSVRDIEGYVHTTRYQG